MIPLDLMSEPFHPHGGIDGKATIRAMGKPGLEFWDLFLRETLQNSWDVRRKRQRGPISFSVDAFTYDGGTCDYMLRELFAKVPQSLEPLKGALRGGQLDVLIVSDEGTRGLGGPVRADLALPDGASSDFVDFIRNVGRDPKKAVGGGTYGFGKAVLYQASSFGTCLIYSQTRVEGEIQPRFIVMSVGDQFEEGARRYTGRHWWGRLGPGSILDPIVGDEARALAESVGLNRFSASSTGTAVAVLGPVLADATPTLKAVICRIASAITTWSWPHTIDTGKGPSINFQLSANDMEVSLKATEPDPLFEQYARAFEHAESAESANEYSVGWPWTLLSIESQRPKRHLGTLAYRSVPALDNEMPDARRERFGHHIALMRDPRFIVKYLPVSEDPSGQATIGVFIAASEADEDFASTEPVAHDDWVPGEYEGESRSNPVRIALRAISSEFKQQTSGASATQGGEHASGTALISRVLGSMLAGTDGAGAESRPIARGASGGGGGSRGTAAVNIAMDPYAELTSANGGVLVDFGFSLEVRPNANLVGLRLEGQPRIVLEGGARERDEDSGEEAPEIVGWFADGAKIGSGAQVELEGLCSGHHSLRVKQSSNTAVTASIRVVESAT